VVHCGPFQDDPGWSASLADDSGWSADDPLKFFSRTDLSRTIRGWSLLFSRTVRGWIHPGREEFDFLRMVQDDPRGRYPSDGSSANLVGFWIFHGLSGGWSADGPWDTDHPRTILKQFRGSSWMVASLRMIREIFSGSSSDDYRKLIRSADDPWDFLRIIIGRLGNWYDPRMIRDTYLWTVRGSSADDPIDLSLIRPIMTRCY
jgi:hypothetical protein